MFCDGLARSRNMLEEDILKLDDAEQEIEDEGDPGSDQDEPTVLSSDEEDAQLGTLGEGEEKSEEVYDYYSSSEEDEEESPRKIAVCSLQGSKKHENQDRYRIIESMNISKWQMTFVGVYDGHGGSHASEFVAQNLHNYIFSDPDIVHDVPLAITRGFEEAERKFEQTG